MDPITLGLISAGVSSILGAWGGRRARRARRRARRALRRARAAELKAALGSLADEEEETKLASRRAVEETDVSFAERGLEDATAEDYARSQIDEATKRRLASIERRRAALIAGARAQDVVSRSQAEIERTQFYANLIGAILGGGVSGVNYQSLFSGA